MKSLYNYLSLGLLIIAFLSINLAPIEAGAKTNVKQERVRMKMYYNKLSSGERMISIELTAGSGKNMHGVSEAEVLLTALVDETTIDLATLQADTAGKVSLYFAEDYVLPQNEDGKTILEAAYEGNDEYRSATNDLEIMDLDLKISFDMEDSVKYLTVLATTKDFEGNDVPAEEVSINIGVRRLYSVLPIDEIETDEDGIGMMEFPNDIPGDAEGNITIVARVDESDDYGTVESISSYNWGLPVDYELKALPRQLFTDEAPLWMIASVFIILLGAWYHFFLSISKLIKLKKEGDAS